MRYLICYDIADDRRRRRIAQWLEGFGHRVHESVFECRLKPAEYRRLLRGAAQRIDAHADRLNIYPLCRRDTPDIIHIAQSTAPDLQGPFVA